MLLALLRGGARFSLLTSLTIHVCQIEVLFRWVSCKARFPGNLFLLPDVDERLCLLLGHEIADKLCCRGGEIVF